jgi:hypothetical protein
MKSEYLCTIPQCNNDINKSIAMTDKSTSACLPYGYKTRHSVFTDHII